MNTNEKTLRMPTGSIALTHEEMELIEGGATLTVKIRASTINKLIKWEGTVVVTGVGALLRPFGSGVAAGAVPVIASFIFAIDGPVKKDQVVKVNIKSLKKNRTITI